MARKIEKDPFRIFFPLGAVFAFAGVAPWVSQLFSHASYPRDLHRMLMINGFLLSFVAGFLLTAIPRFTGARHATIGEIGVIFAGLILATAGALFNASSMNFACASAVIVTLMLFAIRRFRQRQSNPPYTFVFIGVGLSLWLIALIGQIAPIGGQEVFRDLFSNGAIMAIVLGVGGRLIPGILGWSEIVLTQRVQYESPSSFWSVVPFDVWGWLAVFIGSFFLEPFLPLRICFLLRGITTLYFGIKYWVILKPPPTKNFLTWSLWLCCWCLTLGYFLPAIWISAVPHALHLILIGGFSLLTLLISTRVAFAHSGPGVESEKTTRSISVFTCLILMAMLTRVTAILWPSVYFDHLAYAAIFWLLALFVWLWIIFRGQAFEM